MKTNISKKKLTAKLEALMEHVQEVGFVIGNDELNYMTDEYRDQYAELERRLETLIADMDKLTPRH